MMDNATHHPVGQLNTTTNGQNLNIVPQQSPPNNNKLPGEPDHFLTIRLLMQGKVNCLSFVWLFRRKCSLKEVGSIIGKRGDNIKAIREEVNDFLFEEILH